MNSILRWLAAMAAVLLTVTADPALAAPLEAYGRLPLIEDAQISPDGTKIAYALTDGEKRLVVVKSVADGEVVGGINAGDRKLRSIRWAGGEHLIFVVSSTATIADLIGPRQEYMIATAWNLKTNTQSGLMANANNALNVIYDVPEVRMVDGQPVALLKGMRFEDNRGRLGLFRMELNGGGRARTIEAGFENTDDYLIGPEAAAVATTDYDAKSGLWRLRMRQGSGWKTVETATWPIGRPYLAGLGADGKTALLVTPELEGGRLKVREYPLDGSAPKDGTIDSFDEMISDPVTGALLGTAVLEGDAWRYTFYNPKDAAVWRGVAKAYPGAQVRLVSWSDNRRRIVIKVDGLNVNPGYALVDLDAKTADWLGDVYGSIKAADVSPTRAVRYKAADGLEITGYLTLPRGKETRNLALIVLPHGGPAARDQPGFDWWAQALASRGYAVLQPNFRGSSGFGRDFLRKGYGQWGRKMQTDLSDGVRDLAAQGLIDPKRVCIVGASYGGYAALAGVTLDPGVYRCAVSVAGISDLKQFMVDEGASFGARSTASTRYWSRFLGVEGGRDPDLAEISPVSFAAKVEAPVLLIHGKDDTVVRFKQSQIMYDALRRAGKPVDLVTLKAEDHWNSRGATRLQMLQAIVAFLEKHNPPI